MIVDLETIIASSTEARQLTATEELDEKDLLTSADLITCACKIAREIKHYSSLDSHGQRTWISLCYDSDVEHFQLQELPIDLYLGTCGIALFIAALARMTGEGEFHAFAREILHPLCEQADYEAMVPGKSVLSQMSIGAASGLGSCIYTLCYASQWLHAPEYLAAAKQVAALITHERISADHLFDIMEGAAGAILGLMTLYKMTGDQDILQRAVVCGHCLLKQRVGTPGRRCWKSLEQHPLAGFSHGAAGIAYALLRLFEATQRQEFQDAAIEAINFEQQVFVPEAGNWPVLQKEQDTRKAPEPISGRIYRSGWCHGATGIGLARLGGLSWLDTPQVRHDLDVALQTTLAFGLQSPDNLCCGNFGRIELLIASSQRLHRPDLLEEARKLTSLLVHHTAQLGNFHFIARLPRQVYHPSMFQGSAGVGYELLRLADPENVPSVLLWE